MEQLGIICFDPMYEYDALNDSWVFRLGIENNLDHESFLAKRAPEFGGDEGSDSSDTEEVGSLHSDLDEVGSSLSDDSDEESPNPTFKTKKEPKKVVRQSAEFWPCVIILTQVFISCVFDVKSFLKLTEVQQQVVRALLCRILSPGGLEYLKSFLETKQDSVKLRPNDFSKNKSNRIDEVLKLTTSQALKKLYKNFTKANGINKSLDPRKYTKREDINRKIYSQYFNKQPILNEHMQLFKIQGGITRKWFDMAVDHGNKTSAFLEALVTIFRDEESLVRLYQTKVQSMLCSILGVKDFVKEGPSSYDEARRATQVLSKIQTGSARKLKLPYHLYRFQQGIVKTIDKLKKLAAVKKIQLSNQPSTN